MTDDRTTVLDVPERSRFEIRVDGERAGIAAYRIAPAAIRFIHTEVDDAYSRRGPDTLAL